MRVLRQAASQVGPVKVVNGLLRMDGGTAQPCGHECRGRAYRTGTERRMACGDAKPGSDTGGVGTPERDTQCADCDNPASADV